jgi:hypothetical protein
VVINYLQQRFLADDNVGIACVYFNHKESISAVDVLGSLLKHLMQRKATISTAIRSLYARKIYRETRPTLAELSEILQEEARSLSPFFVVIDALDECPEGGDTRAKVLLELRKLQPQLRIMLTGRTYISDDTLKYQEFNRLEIRASDDDIKRYLEGQIEVKDRLSKHVQQNDGLLDTIKDTIASKAKGM